MAEKELKGRFLQKTDTTENWGKAENFKPYKGEVVVYQDGKSSKIKIGDGATVVGDLPFIAGEGGGSGVAGKTYINVASLPRDNIDENIAYRVLEGTFVGQKRFRYDATCYTVAWADAPTGTGESALKRNGDDLTYVGYYNINNNEAYAYISQETKDIMIDLIDKSDLNSVAKAAAKAIVNGLSVGWRTFENFISLASSAVGISWGGIAYTLEEITNENALYIFIGAKTYCRNKGIWTSGDYLIGRRGTDSDAEVFNDLNNIASAPYAHAEGYSTESTGAAAHAEGYNTEASGLGAHAEGQDTHATGTNSHAEGNSTHATHNYTHAEGYGTQATNWYAHAEGVETEATALAAHAEGGQTNAFGDYSHAEGQATTASGDYSHAEGRNTEASNLYAHAEGLETKASAWAAHAEGNNTKAIHNAAHSEGTQTQASGDSSHAEGGSTEASGWASHAEGHTTKATSLAAHAEGLGSQATSDSAHAEGHYTEASGTRSHAEGQNTKALKNASHAEGGETKADGQYTHAEGYKTTAESGWGAHAEGGETYAKGNYSHAEGGFTQAIGDYSHAEGQTTKTEGIRSHAEGHGTIAKADASHAGGKGTIAAGVAQTVIGKYNIENNSALLVVGNGVDNDNRDNAFVVNEDGSAEVYFVDNGNPSSVVNVNYLTDVLATSTSSGVGQTTSQGGEIFNRYDGINKAEGQYSHAEGSGAKAVNKNAHAEGFETTASGHASHAEGNETKASSESAHSEGYKTTAAAYAAHAEGRNTQATKPMAHAEGDGSIASGDASHAEGLHTNATTWGAHAEGGDTDATGNYSHAEGYQSLASGESTHAEGNNTTASGTNSHAEGRGTKAYGSESHSEGLRSRTGDEKDANKGKYAHAEGYETIATGTASHAEGIGTEAKNDSSHAGGVYTVADGYAQTAVGRYNKAGTNSLFVVGDGTGNPASGKWQASTAADAFAVNKDGTITTGKEDYVLTKSVDTSAKAAEFSSLFASATGEVSSFLFFTDPHFFHPENNKRNMESSIKYLQRYYEETPTSFVVNGGDMLQSGDTKAQACQKLGYVDKKLRTSFDRYYYVFGNHDNNYQGAAYPGNQNTNHADELSTEQVRNLCMRDQKKTYYNFLDNTTRYYVFDTGIDWDAASMSDFRWEQVDWFANELISKDDAHNAIIAHQYFYTGMTPNTLADKLLQVAQAYNNKTSITLNGKPYDFSNTKGTVHYYLAGHSHEDRVEPAQNGIPCVVLTRNAYASGWSEPTFDLVLADYAANKLHLVRIGTGENRTVDIIA